MKKMLKFCMTNVCLMYVIVLTACAQNPNKKLLVGAENTQEYIDLLKGKNIAVVANQSSLVKHVHLVDFLLSQNVQVTKIFSPEHGFRGNADAGEKIKNTTDKKTGLPIVSLYGKHFKPSSEDVREIDIVVFDLQDVGVRFYTYISTLHYVMEICAEQNISLLVLDRPNPNGHYVDGPVLEAPFRSFVGMHPVPVVYGMSIGEYARMINGEKWLNNGIQCQLRVVPCKNWKREEAYVLPVKPSPNLPNHLSVQLYPSLCFFEGTVVSAGRGTSLPFQCYGHPLLSNGAFSFVPESIPGASKYPKFKGVKCYGFDLSKTNVSEFRKKGKLELHYLLTAYKELKDKSEFFNSFFEKLAGTKLLRKQLESNCSEEEIRASWEKGIQEFMNVRKNYLIYPEVKEIVYRNSVAGGEGKVVSTY